MRKLAHIEIIKNLEPIEGADQIEKATILGWSVVVKKGEFNIGDSCIYIEIDSRLKNIECFEFLKPRKFKIKIIKLKGIFSYGIAFPLSFLSKDDVLEDGWEYIPDTNTLTSNLMNIDLIEGTDLTEILGIEKYDLEEGEALQASKKFKLNPKKSYISNKISYWKWKFNNWFKKFSKKNIEKGYPKYVPRTDETRIQSYSQKTIENIRGKSFTQTIKMDGSSLTVIKNKKNFIVCSRNLALIEDPNNRFWKAVIKYDLEKKLKSYGKNIALQMELIGEAIQGNRYNIKGVEVRLFRVYDIDKKEYYLPKDTFELSKKLDIPHVGIVNDNFIFNHTIEELVALATTKSIDNPKVHEEGMVFIQNDDPKRFSFKVINPEYLNEKAKKED